jgi:hypothetical protein
MNYYVSRGAIVDWPPPVWTAPAAALASADPAGRWHVVTRGYGRAHVFTSPRLRTPAGAAVLSDVTATDITSTTARLRVTVTF